MVSSVRAVIGSVRRLRESAACWSYLSEHFFKNRDIEVKHT